MQLHGSDSKATLAHQTIHFLVAARQVLLWHTFTIKELVFSNPETLHSCINVLHSRVKATNRTVFYHIHHCRKISSCKQWKNGAKFWTFFRLHFCVEEKKKSSTSKVIAKICVWASIRCSVLLWSNSKHTGINIISINKWKRRWNTHFVRA